MEKPPLQMQRRFFVSVSGSAAGALGAVVAQLEGGALSLVGSADVVLAATYLDLVEGAVLILVVGAAVDGALDAGIGLV